MFMHKHQRQEDDIYIIYEQGYRTFGNLIGWQSLKINLTKIVTKLIIHTGILQ